MGRTNLCLHNTIIILYNYYKLFDMENLYSCGICLYFGGKHSWFHGCTVVSHSHTNYFTRKVVVANQSTKIAELFHFKRYQYKVKQVVLN